MASIAHLAAGALCGAVYARRAAVRPAKPVVAFAALALAPDLDFIALELGSAGTPLDHRVLTHSLTFAIVVGLATGAWLAPASRRAGAAALCIVALASHGILDALTANQPGPRLLWPFSARPIQFAWHPIPGTRRYQEYFDPAVAPIVAGEALLSLPLLVLLAWMLLRPRNERVESTPDP